jgi:hypothetical protein
MQYFFKQGDCKLNASLKNWFSVQHIYSMKAEGIMFNAWSLMELFIWHYILREFTVVRKKISKANIFNMQNS